MELAVAYLISATCIAGLIYLAGRNRRQGWRKPQLEAWREDPAPFAAPATHLQQLEQLNQALAAHGAGIRPRPEAAAVPEERSSRK